MKIRSGVLVAMVFLFTLGVSAAFARSPMTIRVGEPFPDIVLPALEDGSPRSLHDFLGRKVVLHVFASW